MNRKLLFFVMCAWSCFVVLMFNFYAYEIFEINARVRVFVTSGELEHRKFNEEGLPVSISPRVGTFVSPFYVVHYGLYYSDYMTVNPSSRKGAHWREDPSLKYWNAAPDMKEAKNFEKYFYNSASWLVENVSYEFGAAHLLYDFDWPYKGYPSGGLKAPWWSGLTDGYAIILLLRAYDHFGEERFLKTAKDLYLSVLLPTDKGGSLSSKNGKPWIEEYVDPRFSSEEMAYVFNGMVYATYGVEAYEEFSRDNLGLASRLYDSIFSLTPAFDKDGWSYYDLIGNPNNIKYHIIHTVLLEDMMERRPEGLRYKQIESIAEGWKVMKANPGFGYLFFGPVSVATYHFIITLVVLLVFPYFVFLLLITKKSKRGR